jgi:hypothetical protein
MEVTTEQMLDDAYLASRAKLIDMKRAQDFGAGNPVKGGTIYLTAADENGMMVSFIQSNYMGFGSGCVEPTFGISLQNRGHGFSTACSPGANQVAPGKRPFHTIIPAFLTKDGQPVMSFGVMGGNMQPQGHMQTLVRMLDYKQSPAGRLRRAALALQRRPGNQRRTADGPATVRNLQARGHRWKSSTTTTRTSAPASSSGAWATRNKEGYVAASDSRRDGDAGAAAGPGWSYKPPRPARRSWHRHGRELLRRAAGVRTRDRHASGRGRQPGARLLVFTEHGHLRAVPGVQRQAGASASAQCGWWDWPRRWPACAACCSSCCCGR